MEKKTVFFNENSVTVCEANEILPVEKGMGVEVWDETGHTQDLKVQGVVLALRLKQTETGIPTIGSVELRVGLGPLK